LEKYQAELTNRRAHYEQIKTTVIANEQNLQEKLSEATIQSNVLSKEINHLRFVIEEKENQIKKKL